jgi:hypothetical protein
MSAQSISLPTFVPWDIAVARVNFGANCGPASFAALVGREVCRVIGHFPQFEHSKWTNLTQMLRALESADYDAEVRRRVFPSRGLALIQWLGPWTERDFFSRWSLSHTHWVAVEGPWVFDHTVEKWQGLRAWAGSVTKEFVSEIPMATGWAVKYGVEAKKKTVVGLSPPARALARRVPA